ncbi:MAG: DUF2948 family protein [Filomicrobium sp.]
MSELKLLALDAEDLQIVSAHLQDAVGRVGDIAYDKAARRLVLVLNRFDWDGVSDRKSAKEFERRQCGLRFDKVKAVRSLGFDRSKPNEVVSLLAIQFEEQEAPSGLVTLYFSGGPQLAVEVECIETELRDLGAAWKTDSKPDHPDGDEPK